MGSILRAAKWPRGSFLGFLVGSVALLVWSGSYARAATTLVSDTFTGTNGATIDGRTPDGIDVPGRNESSKGIVHMSIDTGLGNAAPSMQTGSNSTMFIDISSGGSYTKPTLLTLTADVQVGAIVTDGGPRGIGLGYFSPAPVNNVEANTNFTGLLVKTTGQLELVKQGTMQASVVAPAFSGFAAANFYTLTYTVDTSTGSITNVNFNGNDDTSTFSGSATAGDFTSTITNLAGVYGSSAAGTTGRVDNFSVSDVPEPSTCGALLPLVLGSLTCRRLNDRGRWIQSRRDR